MCGILGVVGDRLPDPEAFLRALRTLAARGPDDEGIATEAGALLGHRRLSILDPSPAGHQPMASHDGRYLLTYNGEIYNYRELRAGLEREGVRFRSTSDTELLVELLAREGARGVSQLVGMFAFGLWDRQSSTLLLARDPLGIKPLYVQERPGGLAFASETRALCALPGGPTRVAGGAAASFLRWGSMHGPRTLHEGVELLAAGTAVTFAGGSASRHVYWRFPTAAPDVSTREEAAALLRPALLEAVRRRCVSDVPLGAFLSGGIDSSAIVMLMRAAGQSDVRTFSLSFPGTALDEAAHAARVAADFRTQHTAVAVDEGRIEESLDPFFAAMDQPTCDGLNTYLVSRFAKASGLTVALSGLGGDELFGGYPSFRRARRVGGLLVRTPRAVGRAFGRAAGGLPSRRMAKLAWLDADASAAARLFAVSRTLFTETETAALTGQDLPRTQLLEPRTGASLWHATMELELAGYTEPQLLRDSDVFGMAHGLEIRVPFIDEALVGLVARVAPAAFQGGQKALLLAALPEALPASITARPKMGFTMPFDRWLRGPWQHRLEGMWSRANHAGLEERAVRAVWTRFLAGRTHWSRPWSLYVWIRRVAGEHGDAR